VREIDIKWSLPEYERREKHKDWYWALAIMIVASALTALIYGNLFFAILLILGGVLMWYFGKKDPEVVDYELNEKGLMIKNRVFPYESLKAFFVSFDLY